MCNNVTRVFVLHGESCQVRYLPTQHASLRLNSQLHLTVIIIYFHKYRICMWSEATQRVYVRPLAFSRETSGSRSLFLKTAEQTGFVFFSPALLVVC